MFSPSCAFDSRKSLRMQRNACQPGTGAKMATYHIMSEYFGRLIAIYLRKLCWTMQIICSHLGTTVAPPGDWFDKLLCPEPIKTTRSSIEKEVLWAILRRARRLLLVKNFRPLAAAILINCKDEMKNLKTHRCCSLQLAPQSITRTVHMKYWQPRCPICSMRVKDIWDWPRPLSPRSFTVVHRSHFVILQSLYRSEISTVTYPATLIEHRTSSRVQLVWWR
jgi:hypothetical protein